MRIAISILLLLLAALSAVTQPVPPPAPPSWRFVDREGRPVKAVSEVRLLPLKLDRGIPAVAEDREDISALRQVIRQPDGNYCAPRAPAGTYRLLIDLYDLDVPSPPEFIIVLFPDMPVRTVTLPPPLLTVQAGAEVSWLAKNSPAVFHRLVAGAWAEAMPVYGPRDALLALWYPEAPGKLAVWQFMDGAIVKSQLTLRTVYIQPTDGGQAFPDPFYIMPLFPTTWRYHELPAGGNHLLLRSDEARLNLGPETGCRADLWTGQYLVTGEPPNRDIFDVAPPPRRSLLRVPEDGPATLSVPLVLREAPAEKPRARRTIFLAFPDFDYQQVKDSTARFLTLAFDSRPGLDFLVARDALINRTSWNREAGQPEDTAVVKLDIPPDTARLSVRWLGFGEMPEVPIPPAQPDKPTVITLPDWQPGRTASLTIQLPLGAPATNLTLRVVRRYAFPPHEYGHLLVDEFYSGSHDGPPSDEVLDVQTDAAGKLSLKGLAAGWQYLVAKSENAELEGWVLQVPEKESLRATLRRTAAPAGFPGGNASETRWWIPEQGQPVPGVSRLEMMPVAVQGSFPFMGSGRTLKAPADPVLIEREGGKFTFSALLPGTYRLLIDMYDASTEPPPGMLLRVRSGLNELTIELPPPLLALPAGTEVCWLARNAPRGRPPPARGGARRRAAGLRARRGADGGLVSARPEPAGFPGAGGRGGAHAGAARRGGAVQSEG